MNILLGNAFNPRSTLPSDAGFAIKAARGLPVTEAVRLVGNRPGTVMHAFADGRPVAAAEPNRERGPVA